MLRRLLIPILVLCLATATGVVRAQGAAEEPLRLAYVDWSSEIASAHMVKAVIEEDLGRRVLLTEMAADEMWQAVASGEQDAMVAAWLPETHGHYYAQVKDRVVDLGPNLEGARIGLVVPDVSPGRQTGRTGQRNRPYITIDSIEEIDEHADRFGGRILGIDREAGIMKATREALEVYGLAPEIRLIEGSEDAMTAELASAIQKKEWVVVTGWQPHWMFGRWTMRFLDDPKGVYGGEERIHTIVRPGLENDMPEVHAFLDNFYWTPDEMDQLMVWNQMEDGDPYRSAVRWIEYNRSRVEEWLP